MEDPVSRDPPAGRLAPLMVCSSGPRAWEGGWDHVRKGSSGGRRMEGRGSQRAAHESCGAVSSRHATSVGEIRNVLVPSALHTRGLARRVEGMDGAKRREIRARQEREANGANSGRLVPKRGREGWEWDHARDTGGEKKAKRSKGGW